MNDSTSNGAYGQDGENNPHFTNVKDLLVVPADFTAGSSANGVVFVDGKAEGVTIAEYANQGPNNETYLKNGNGIAFKLRYKGTSKPTINLHIGAKLAVGSSATLKCNGSELATLTTATNMFYKLPALTWTKVGEYWVSNAVVLSCEAGTDSILSLTDLKVTGADAAKIEGMPTADNGTGAGLETLIDDEVVESAQKYMTAGSDSEGGDNTTGGDNTEGGNNTTGGDNTTEGGKTEDATTQPTTKPEEETTKPSGSGNKPSQDGSNAKTGDEIMLFVMLMVFSLMGMGAATVLRKKEEI
jgi:hypothetical protein